MRQRIGLVVLIVLLIFIINAFLNPIPKRDKVEGNYPNYGTSYSFEQASWYGLDAQRAYIDLISNYNFDWIRIPFFWNQMIDEKGALQIDDLKFAVEEAEKRNVKVIIALGAKTPYYPEFHLPDSLSSQLGKGEEINIDSPIAEQILEIDRKLIEELRGYENISYWQIENEPFTPNENGWTLSENLIREEIKVVRDADSVNRPIILSHVGPAVFDLRFQKLLKLLEPGDVLGVNAYFKTQAPNLINLNIFGNQLAVPWPRGFFWPVQSWGFFSPNFEGIGNTASKSGVDVWVMELQAEPYVRNLEEARRREFSFNANDIKAANDYISSKNVETIGLWGAPFWLYRESIDDSGWVEMVKSIVN